MMKKLLLAMTFGLIMFQTEAQIINVNSISYSPSAPSECTDLIIDVDGISNCSNYLFDSISATVVGTNIEVDVYYTSSFVCLGALSPFSHSINLGQLPVASYTVTARGFLDLNVDDLINPPNIVVATCCTVVASFSSDYTLACSDDAVPVNFSSTSVSAATNNWYVNTVFASSGPSFTLPTNIAGAYNVKLVSSNGTCTDSTSQMIIVHQSPNLDLGNDTTSCLGSNHDIIAPTGFSSYSWTNSTSTTNTASVTATNTYMLTAIDANGCSDSDDVLVTFNTLPVFSLGSDTSICSGQSLTLDAGTFSSYSWNTAETTQTITANASFNYVAIVTDANNCSNSDDISVTVNNLPTVDLAQDTFEICSGDALNLSAGSSSSYLWSTLETTNSISVNSEGAVSVTVTDMNNCSNSDNTYVKVNELPTVDLGADQDLCSTDNLDLSGGTFVSYIWNDGTTNSSLNLDATNYTIGNYTFTLSVSDVNGCNDTDSVIITVKDCNVGISSMTLENAISVYPNPVQDILNININEKINSDIKIYTIQGKEILNIKSKSLSANSFLELSSLKTGIYFIEFTIENKKMIQQFVKK